MDETLTFFAQLLAMTQTMVDDIVPDLLIDLDQKVIKRLLDGAQNVDNSLQMFIKVCTALSQSPSRSCSNKELQQTLEENMMTAEVEHNKFNSKESQPAHSSSGGDTKSAITNFSDLTVNEDEEENVDEYKLTVWHGLLAEAKNWYISHDPKQIPQVYYCGVCDKKAKAKHVWEAHLGGKNHLKLIEDVCAIHSICDVCNMHIYGDFELIRVITASREHYAFDTLIKDNDPINAAHSTVAGCFGKGTVTKKNKADLSINLDLANMKPISSAASSTMAQDPPKVSKVIFQNTEIHSDFVHLTDTIADYIEKHEAFKIAYCRPCEIICENEELWNKHKITRLHTNKMASKHYKNVLCRCVQCDFIVTASVKIAISYMRYHIERAHRQSTEGIKNEEYMEVKDMLLGAKVQKLLPSSKASSFKGSKETIYSVRSCAEFGGSLADMQSSSTDLHSCVALTLPLKPVADASASTASSGRQLDAESMRSCRNDLQSSSDDSLSSSSDMRSYLDQKRASRADASAPDVLARNTKDLGSNIADHNADRSTHAANSTRSTGTVRKTSTNPYKSGVSRAPSAEVSNQDEQPAQISPTPSITLPLLPAQIPFPAENYAPPALAYAPPTPKGNLPGDLEFTFLKMLSKKEESFRKDTSFTLFTALCLVCKSADFCSRRAWLRHLKSHDPTDSVGEVPCLQCNSRFFGDVGDIYSSFINHDYHVCIDAMFSW